MIDVRAIRKSFGSLEVLKGIDLHIDKGEVVSIVGPSGAGKTTLLQIMGTLDRPDSGSIVVDGVDISSLSQKRLSALWTNPLREQCALQAPMSITSAPTTWLIFAIST